MSNMALSRKVLLGTLVAGGALAFVTLTIVGRGGAISGSTAEAATKGLLEHYLPLLTIAGAFLFSDHRRSNRSRYFVSSTETFAFAFIVVAIWAMLPPLLLVLSDTVEGAFRQLDSFKIFGSSLSVGAFTYYFASSTPHPTRTGNRL